MGHFSVFVLLTCFLIGSLSLVSSSPTRYGNSNGYNNPSQYYYDGYNDDYYGYDNYEDGYDNYEDGYDNDGESDTTYRDNQSASQNLDSTNNLNNMQDVKKAISVTTKSSDSGDMSSSASQDNQNANSQDQTLDNLNENAASANNQASSSNSASNGNRDSVFDSQGGFPFSK